MSNKPKYKTTRKYKCPYCDFKASRNDLVDHVEKKHEELIPNGYTAARAVYDFVNGKDYGVCMICKSPVYKWNDKINRYYNLCDNPACRKSVRDTALQRHIKVYNKPTLLNDEEHQEKMLANRRISGKYTFSDGTIHTFTGKYEKNALEFMDKVMEIPGKDIQCPGPVLNYTYKGETHKWITDIYYIPANLLIEIKDGGSNPNNRSMVSYREKQIAKEEMITSIGTFNYVRLTNNNFAQLLDVLADIKNEAINSNTENPLAKIHINEEVGGIPPQRPPEAYVIPYGMNNTFAGFAYGDMGSDVMTTIDPDNKFETMTKSKFMNEFDIGPTYIYQSNDALQKINEIRATIRSGSAPSKMYFVEALVGRTIRNPEEINYHDQLFTLYDEKEEEAKTSLIENAMIREASNILDTNVIKTIGRVCICKSNNNMYYAVTPQDMYLVSDYYSDVESLISSGIVDLMNNIYMAEIKRKIGERNGGSENE